MNMSRLTNTNHLSVCQDFAPELVRIWMEENWRSVCAWASGIYMLLIFGGQTYMANR